MISIGVQNILDMLRSVLKWCCAHSNVNIDGASCCASWPVEVRKQQGLQADLEGRTASAEQGSAMVRVSEDRCQGHEQMGVVAGVVRPSAGLAVGRTFHRQRVEIVYAIPGQGAPDVQRVAGLRGQRLRVAAVAARSRLRVRRELACATQCILQPRCRARRHLPVVARALL